MSQSNTTQTGVTLTAGGGIRRQFTRQDRAIGQMMKITNISGTTLTFETPFHYPFQAALSAQLCTFTNLPQIWEGMSVENLGTFGGVATSITASACANSWGEGS